MRNIIKNILLVSILFNCLLLNSNLHSKSIWKTLSNFNKKNWRKIVNLFDNFHTVEKGKLYRSKQLNTKTLKSYIKKYDIKTVINLRGENPGKKWWEEEKMATNDINVNFYNIPLSAVRLPSKQHIKELLGIYDNALGPILIHCQGGADRTGMASALWKLYKEEKDKKTAQKQLSIKFGHRKLKNPAMDFLINIWEGKDWLLNIYDPQNYPAYS